MSHGELQRRSLAAAQADAGAARAGCDDVAGWVDAGGAGPADPLGADVWVFDPALAQVLLVFHPWRGWVPPGGKVEPGETPRVAARRELREETGVDAELLDKPAAAFVRSFKPGRPATLSVSYVAIADPAAVLVPEPGQPAAWRSLDDPWEGWFADDRSRMREHAQWLAGAVR
ncbi:NUDIX hydrolase [Actinoplanes sp. NPDC049596]|uniref:NUDIX hydrolase n=1 Tax=Actinoplanes sp. NPDC049596 TaxID=3154625 RepID=UPI0034149BEC